MPLSEFESQLAVSWPPESWSDVTVLVAVSGGPDSVALARGLAAIRQNGPGRLIAAHFNHRLRGADSDADEAFCRQLADELGWLIEVGGAGGVAEYLVPGTRYGEVAAIAEEATRRERHAFLLATAARVGARSVATAHTADDQAETILHRIVRGTGLAGLAGIPRVRPLGQDIVLIRPLLGVRRTDVLAYLEVIRQPYRTDATNRDSRYTRNRIRHELLPNLADRYNPAIVDALLRLGTQAGEAHEIIDGPTEKLLERCVVRRDARQVAINCHCLAGEPRHLVRGMFVRLWRRQGWAEQAMGFDHWNLLAGLALSTIDAIKMLPGKVSAERQFELLWLERGSGYPDGMRPRITA